MQCMAFQWAHGHANDAHAFAVHGSFLPICSAWHCNEPIAMPMMLMHVQCMVLFFLYAMHGIAMGPLQWQ